MKKLIFSFLLLLIAAYVAWPYATLYQLNQAVSQSDMASMTELVDLDAIRTEIKNKMNKEVDSAVGEVSGNFIAWLQDGIRRLGSGAVDGLVNMEWVRQQLIIRSADNKETPFINHVSYAFFDSPTGFLVRIGELGEDPVHFRLTLQQTQWRITAVYN